MDAGILWSLWAVILLSGSVVAPPAPAPGRGLELGTTYEYALQSDVYLNEASAKPQEKTSRSVGYGLQGDVQVACIWRNPVDPLHRLLKVQFVNVHLTVTPADSPSAERTKHASDLDSATQLPLYVLQQGNEITRVWSHDEPLTSINIKKGVASMFQYQLTSETKQQVDVSGKCTVAFKTEGTHVQKTKSGCTHPDHSQFFHPSFVQSASVNTESATFYELLPDLTAPKSIQSTEEGNFLVNAWKEAHIVFSAEHKLKLKGTSQSRETLSVRSEAQAIQQLTKKEAIKDDTIVARPEPKTCEPSCKSLADTVKLYRDNLRSKNLATLKSAISFLRLLPKFREASGKDILGVLKKNKKIAPQLLDLTAAAQTVSSVKASLKFLDLDSDSDLPERFFVSLVSASHPGLDVIAEILAAAKKTMKNGKNKASAVVALGALVKTYCRAHANCGEQKEISGSLTWMEEQLRACKQEECWQTYLGGLLNAAHPATADTLLYAIQKGSRKTVITALRALKRFGKEHIGDKVYDAVERVYGQVDRRHDSTARALAAELIFLSGDEGRIRRVVEHLPSKEAPELATFIISKLYELVDHKPEVRDTGRRVLQNVTIGNYYNLAQTGSSAAFTKYLAKTDHLNSTYGINMELIPGGLLKTSSVDVHVETPLESMNILSVGLFAGGLGNVAGGGDDTPSDQEEEEATGGMRLTLLGTELRPYVFFVGTSELMGHVWSGTASEPTPALQGNLLIMDHYQFAPLLNGLVVELQLHGAISLDLSGSIQISIWNRNSHSVVKTSGAAVIQASASLNSGPATSHVQLNVAGDTHLEFITDLEFYEKPYKMCIQMTTPGLVLRHNVRKQESVHGKKHLVRTLKRRSQTLSGKSYALHRKNCEYCSAMLADS